MIVKVTFFTLFKKPIIVYNYILVTYIDWVLTPSNSCWIVNSIDRSLTVGYFMYSSYQAEWCVIDMVIQ